MSAIVFCIIITAYYMTTPFRQLYFDFIVASKTMNGLFPGEAVRNAEEKWKKYKKWCYDAYVIRELTQFIKINCT